MFVRLAADFVTALELAAPSLAQSFAILKLSSNRMPETDQSRLIQHAPTFLEEAEDRSNFDLDPAPLRPLGDRIVLTRGTHSPPHLHALTGALAIALPEARLHDIEGAGRIPHLTHPDLYADVIRRHLTGGPPDSRR